MKYMTNFDAGYGEAVTVISECKLLLSNITVTVLSTEIFCDDVLAGAPYRLTEAENVELFDPTLLPRIRISDPISPVIAAIAYGRVGEGYRFIISGEASPTAYAAVVMALFYKGRLARGENTLLSSDSGAFYATVTDDGALLFV